MVSTDKVIYLDLDGVIADFTEGVFNAHDREDLVAKHSSGDWPIDWNYHGELGEPDAWIKKVEELGEVFWEYLNAYQWKNRLIMALEETGIPWYICTTPAPIPSCLSGKMKWLQHHLGKFNLIMIKDKWRLAHQNALLIDDNDTNCDKFFEAGGSTILFPQSWNANRDLVTERMDYFLKCLNVFSQETTLAIV